MNGALKAELDRALERKNQIALVVETDLVTDMRRLHSGLRYCGFAMVFETPDRAHIEQIIHRLNAGGLLCDLGIDDGARPWERRILDGRAFEVRADLRIFSGCPQDYQSVDGDLFDPDWFGHPRDRPDDRPRVAHQGASGMVPKDLDITSGRTVFREKVDGRDYRFEIREADGTVIKTLSGSENGGQYIEPHVYFDISSEGHRVRFQHPGEADKLLDLPPPASVDPLDFAQFDLTQAIIPKRFYGDAPAAIARAAANGTTYIIDEGWAPYRVVRGVNGQLELLPPDEQHGPDLEDGSLMPMCLHALLISGGPKSFCIKVANGTPKPDHIARFEAWMHALRPGRGIRDSMGKLFGGQRFEVQSLKLTRHNSWRNKSVFDADHDPATLTIT
ncbi:hypothetical protein [Tateyamaria sp. SN6-1]|uniref:hypothetical protein n=1 Tax=Tateyamaria sp. SN6-1 TaxID=3092148 RepID=UPI0039F5E4F0